MNTILSDLGKRLRMARKANFPLDTQTDFATRIRVSRGTLQSMEQGSPRVALGAYFEAAQILNIADQFNALFIIEQPAKSLLEEFDL